MSTTESSDEDFDDVPLAGPVVWNRSANRIEIQGKMLRTGALNTLTMAFTNKYATDGNGLHKYVVIYDWKTHWF